METLKGTAACWNNGSSIVIVIPSTIDVKPGTRFKVLEDGDRIIYEKIKEAV